MDLDVAEAVSLLSTASPLFPWLLLAAGSVSPAQCACWFAGCLLNLAVVVGLKAAAGTRVAAFRRPAGACGCGALGDGGPAAGKQGFPSGHTAQIASFFALGALLTRSWAVAAAGAPVVVAVAWARCHKRCHTLLQVAVGGLVGIATACVFCLAVYMYGWRWPLSGRFESGQ
jgi:membrane-associated phospholipid phosphatase